LLHLLSREAPEGHREEVVEFGLRLIPTLWRLLLRRGNAAGVDRREAASGKFAQEVRLLFVVDNLSKSKGAAVGC
jgi:hypothetical protein